MRKVILVSFAVMALAYLVGPVGLMAEVEKKSEKIETTLEGRLLDLTCYTMGMEGEKHAKCALNCAEKGLPVGVLESKTGKVYTVLLPSPGLAPYTEKTVRITGKIHNEVLISPSMMEVREGETWKVVKLPSAM